jgi:hypothetical protein
MVRKKPTRRKRPAGRKKSASARRPARTKPRKKPEKKRPVRRRATAKKHPATVRKKRPDERTRMVRTAGFDVVEPEATRGLGPEAGGQSGDIEGLSRDELADSESVEELIEEGQAFEAGIISGVENAPDADRGGVRTREVPEDDVPQEYLDED